MSKVVSNVCCDAKSAAPFGHFGKRLLGNVRDCLHAAEPDGPRLRLCFRNHLPGRMDDPDRKGNEGSKCAADCRSILGH
jgi:hypothetical protein